MPKIGETVRYGQSGLCKVEGKCEKDIGGQKQEYFVLSPLFKKGAVVFVPCENEELVRKMCPPLTEGEIKALLEQVAESEAEWIRDFRRRSEISKRALSSNDRVEALLLVKNIYAHRKEIQGKGARVHTTDDYFLKDAENLIYTEIAYVQNKEYEQVEKEVKAFLKIEE
jgi:CarD family transcriptional regulator